jgi:hypothetical protein
MGIVRRLLLVVLLAAGSAHARESGAWKRMVAGAEVDWNAGTITAEGGAAADLRMPGPNSARPGAERAARAAAAAKLRAALRELGLDQDAEKGAVEHSTVSCIEYQSNGGAVLWLTAKFSDATVEKAAPRPLRVSTVPFRFSPTIAGGGKSVRAASATYHAAADCPTDAILVKRNDKGHLVLPSAEAGLIDSFAGASVVIYVEKPEP